MKNKLLIMAMVMIVAFGFTGCRTYSITHHLTSIVVSRDPLQTFDNHWSNGIVVHVEPTQPEQEKTGSVYHFSGKDFFYVPTAQYVRSMGLVEMSSSTDYQLYIKINKADVVFPDVANVEISVRLCDAHGNEVFSQNRIATNGVYDWKRTNKKASPKRMYQFQEALDEAYTKALEQINWNRVVSFLRTEQLPKEEPQKQVQGYGDTALEQTIIRWDVQSRPQGADVFWRVVSKTPEVKSTNNKYLQTTPYEATKALDIRGLTYQTSGNVRIILRCEKDGYLPQEKEFDVRMVLDQEEISAFFRLVKEE